LLWPVLCLRFVGRSRYAIKQAADSINENIATFVIMIDKRSIVKLLLLTQNQEVVMDIRLPEDSQFSKYYTKHCKYLKLKGLQPKTIEAYARTLRRIGNYFDGQLKRLWESLNCE